jgi:hypothetical protein
VEVIGAAALRGCVRGWCLVRCRRHGLCFMLRVEKVAREEALNGGRVNDNIIGKSMMKKSGYLYCDKKKLKSFIFSPTPHQRPIHQPTINAISYTTIQCNIYSTVQTLKQCITALSSSSRSSCVASQPSHLRGGITCDDDFIVAVAWLTTRITRLLLAWSILYLKGYHI